MRVAQHRRLDDTCRMQPEPIYKYMTVCPLTVGRTELLQEAKKLMVEKGIRHLPVLDAGVLVGVVSERDADLVLALAGKSHAKVSVEDAMTSEPFIVSADAKLSRVTSDMAKHKYGCAIVVERGAVAGVFTTVDALRVLSKLLEAEAGPLSAR
jgi:acetoin utilization protein AcuB